MEKEWIKKKYLCKHMIPINQSAIITKQNHFFFHDNNYYTVK